MSCWPKCGTLSIESTPLVAEFRRRSLVILAWMMGWTALTLGGCVTAAPVPAYRFGPNNAYQCAQELGIAYTFEDGATERLDSFYQCMTDKGATISTIPHN